MNKINIKNKKINNLRKHYLELINYEISYKHYVLFLFV